MASNLARAPRNGFVLPSTRFHDHRLLFVASSSTSGTFVSAKPSIGCCVRTTSGASLSSSKEASSCGLRSSGISWSVAPDGTIVLTDTRSADVKRTSDRQICPIGTSGAHATATPASVSRSQAIGPAKPSRRLVRASAAARGATTSRMAQTSASTASVINAPAPSSQMGGTATNQRLAKSGIMAASGGEGCWRARHRPAAPRNFRSVLCRRGGVSGSLRIGRPG